MEFEFDEDKSASNKVKHGIDFREAQALWSDSDLIEIPAKTSDEPRFLLMGQIAGEHWAAVITYRGDKTRIISVRRAGQKEIDIYESA